MALFKRKEPILGIDIGPSAVKLVELSRSGSRFRVEGFAIEPLSEGMVEDRNPTDTDGVAEAVRRACRKAGVRARRAAVAVPTSSVITRTVPMPADFKENEVETNLAIEAAQYIPYPIEEVYLDFETKGLSPATGEMQEVMLVATRKENVDTREATLKNAGLKPAIVDVEAYALENAFRLLMEDLAQASSGGESASQAKPRTSLTALVDIGAAITTLYILQQDRVIFTREQRFGCDQLTTRIAEAYDLSREQAEQARRSGAVNADYAETILEPFKQMLAEQIGHGLQFFFSSDQYASGRYVADTAVLSGGGATILGLDRVVADVLGITTVVANPFRNMGTAARVNSAALLRDAPLLTIACGLALRSFD